MFAMSHLGNHICYISIKECSKKILVMHHMTDSMVKQQRKVTSGDLRK
jgi:hypothetical protein